MRCPRTTASSTRGTRRPRAATTIRAARTAMRIPGQHAARGGRRHANPEARIGYDVRNRHVPAATAQQRACDVPRDGRQRIQPQASADLHAGAGRAHRGSLRAVVEPRLVRSDDHRDDAARRRTRSCAASRPRRDGPAEPERSGAGEARRPDGRHASRDTGEVGPSRDRCPPAALQSHSGRRNWLWKLKTVDNMPGRGG